MNGLFEFNPQLIFFVFTSIQNQTYQNYKHKSPVIPTIKKNSSFSLVQTLLFHFFLKC